MEFVVALNGGYEISDAALRLDVDAIHRFLSMEAYWSPGVPRALVERSITYSLCLGLYAPDASQAGFARVISDRAHMAHLADVFVLSAHRGRGLGKQLVAAALGHPDLATIRRWTLQTSDAHALYAAFGFKMAVATGTLLQRVTTPDWLKAPPPA